MLNKETCKRCITNDAGVTWTRHDEERWSNGLVLCYSDLYMFPIRKPPPSDCLYVFEHALAAGDPDAG